MEGLFVQNIMEISVLTILQYINYKMTPLPELNMHYLKSANGVKI